jgi:hypothetical protein
VAAKKQAAQFLAAADADRQMCLQAKPAAATSPTTGDSRADLCRQLDQLTVVAEYAAFKSSHTFAPQPR